MNKMKSVLALLLALVMIIGLVACGNKKDDAKTTESTGKATDAPAKTDAAKTSESKDKGGEAPAGKDKPYEIAVIIKATSSDFWQYVLVGAENYMKEFPDTVKVTTYGPPEEADIDQQVNILEDVIQSGPDAIVIASTSSDATVPAIEEAVGKGIPVITIDNRVKTDKVTSFLATNNLKGGASAADHMHKLLVEQYGQDGLKGKAVGVVSAMAGVQVLVDRDEGFLTRMKELAPDLEILETRYVDNDMAKAMNAAEDLIQSTPNLIGLFGDNNITGSGVGRVVSQQNKQEEIIVCAFDSDPEEIKQLKDGVIRALILQDPYGMGYKGVDFAVQSIEGKEVPKEVDTGATLVTKDNMDEDAIKGLLDPYSLKK